MPTDNLQLIEDVATALRLSSHQSVRNLDTVLAPARIGKRGMRLYDAERVAGLNASRARNAR